jgi:hypothetical protein
VFTEADLLVDISRVELDGIAKTLTTATDPQPIATTISEQSRKVDDYTRRHALELERENRLVRALVLFELSARLGKIPEKRQRKYDEAMRELRDIRDGKFPDLALKDPLPGDLAGLEGYWGSERKMT